jgi:hypothetical protein
MGMAVLGCLVGVPAGQSHRASRVLCSGLTILLGKFNGLL